MSTSSELCPRCRETVAMYHDGSTQGVDERSSPWRFSGHTFLDSRGSAVREVRCPASGRNLWSASHAW